MNQSVSDVISIKPSAWTVAQIEALLDLPFGDLIHRAQLIHRQYHDANAVQLSTLISVKTGGCPEDCGYCPQAARYHTSVEDQEMLSLTEVIDTARAAKAQGLHGSAWVRPGEVLSSGISVKYQK